MGAGMDHEIEIEILPGAATGPAAEPAGAAGRAAEPSGRRPDRRTRRVVVVVAVVAAVVAAGFVAARAVPDQDVVPGVVVAGSPSGSDSGSRPAAWTVDADRRPAGPVTLDATVLVHRQERLTGEVARRPDRRLWVLGLAGPGVTGNDLPEVEIPPGGEDAEVPIRALLDCSRVPEVPAPEAYGLRMRSGRGAAAVTGPTSAGDMGRRWGRVAAMACATWAARRSLTVTDVQARVDPVEARVDLTLDLRNDGSREATFQPHPLLVGGGLLAGVLPVRIPAHGRTQARVRLTIPTCPMAQSEDDQGSLSSWIGMVAVVGHPAPVAEASPTPGSPVADAEIDVTGTLSPTGVVMLPLAQARLGAALQTACADLAQGPQVPDSGREVEVDTTTGTITFRLEVDLPPGRVRSLTVTSDPVGSLNGARPAFEALPTDGRPLVPDAQGRVRVEWRYRRLPGTPCADSFIASAQLTARISTATGERRVPLSVPVGQAGLPTGLCAAG